MDLGRKIESLTLGSSFEKKDGPKVSYPGFTLSDKVAETYCEDNDCKMGDEITATVRMKVTSHRADEYGKSVGFDVLSMDDVKPAGDGDKDKEDDAAEERLIGVKLPKGKKESFDTSAKSFMQD